MGDFFLIRSKAHLAANQNLNFKPKVRVQKHPKLKPYKNDKTYTSNILKRPDSG